MRLGRQTDELRPLSMERDVAKFADGSVIVRLGDTHVLCTVKIVDGVPGWRRGSGFGWLTAEYSMLPAADRRPHAPRGGPRQAGRPHAGDPAADRPQPAGRGRPRFARRAHDPPRLRRAAGVRRHAHGGHLGRLRGARDRLGETEPRRPLAALPLFEDVAAVSVGIVAASRSSTSTTPKISAAARHERRHDGRGSPDRGAGHRRGRALSAGDPRHAARSGRRRGDPYRGRAAGDHRGWWDSRARRPRLARRHGSPGGTGAPDGGPAR